MFQIESEALNTEVDTYVKEVCLHEGWCATSGRAMCQILCQQPVLTERACLWSAGTKTLLNLREDP